MTATHKSFKTAWLFLAAFVLTFTLTVASSLIHRTGPEMSAYGNLCGKARNEPCYEPMLKGGFPFAYIYDAPGISVEHRLSIEDDFAIVWFIADWLVYLLLVVSLYFGIRRATK